MLIGGIIPDRTIVFANKNSFRFPVSFSLFWEAKQLYSIQKSQLR